ncbi:hypothetical protein GQX73_g5722 [Xylaria multiplex]|uniref:CENP-V/GFA domain-containing protein n=1 Tax=Xylaria multiplex TaxID=323545 RepID=A0A7C8N466_9PEZI|nr:hypothetical protein GQX73_g5722 [Xylaria multiplex]
MAEEQAPPKTYRGNCHCAAFVYEISLPEIKQASECNCSICYKKSTIWVFPKPSDVKFVKGDSSALTNYNFNNKQKTHKFCSTCGVSLMVVGYLRPLETGENRAPDNGFNIRTFQHGQIDVWKLDIKTFDGSALPPKYEVPKFTGPQPVGDSEDLQLYTGSCHCGAVTVGLKSKPLDKNFQGAMECNCSICGRYGATWTYPPKAQVVTEGRGDLGVYLFNKNIASKKFCKICGVPVYSEAVQCTEEQVAQMDEGSRQWYTRSKDLIALNLRVINGLDVKDLNATRFDGYTYIQPGYVEP